MAESPFVRETHPLSWFAGRRVTVMGLGLFGGGLGAIRFLCRHGARVTVTDVRGEDVLRPALEALEGLPARFVLGGHREEDFLGADLVIPSPAVPRQAPLLELCARRGIPLETEMNLFFKHCPGRICGITGSNGKTTTTLLVGHVAALRWPGVRVGGNVGRSLLPELESIAPGEWVVLEISSFQLEDLAVLERRPEVAVITNLSPNHLDRHGSYARYVAAKEEILRPGPHPGVAVLNGEDALCRRLAGRARRRIVHFGRTGRPWPRGAGVWIAPDGVFRSGISGEGRRERLFTPAALRLPGRFNLFNAAAAAAAATAMGLGPEEIERGVSTFRGAEHRLEPAGTVGGIECVNDSIATTPESTVAALETLGPRVVLICGGAPKATSYAALAWAASHWSRAVVVMGATAEEIASSLQAVPRPPPLHRARDLEEAVACALEVASPGDRVLLSPACPSYDQFVNFQERGVRFKAIVRRLAGR